jgi:hypothetical protein
MDRLEGKPINGYVCGLVGDEPVYNYDNALALPGRVPSAELRTTITGPAAVVWKDGLRRIVEFWEPKIRAGAHASRQRTIVRPGGRPSGETS